MLQIYSSLNIPNLLSYHSLYATLIYQDTKPRAPPVPLGRCKHLTTLPPRMLLAWPNIQSTPIKPKFKQTTHTAPFPPCWRRPRSHPWRAHPTITNQTRRPQTRANARSCASAGKHQRIPPKLSLYLGSFHKNRVANVAVCIAVGAVRLLVYQSRV